MNTTLFSIRQWNRITFTSRLALHRNAIHQAKQIAKINHEIHKEDDIYNICQATYGTNPFRQWLTPLK